MTIFVILLMVQNPANPLDMVNIALFTMFCKSQLFQISEPSTVFESVWLCLKLCVPSWSFVFFLIWQHWCGLSCFYASQIQHEIFVRSPERWIRKSVWLDYRSNRIQVWCIYTYIYIFYLRVYLKNHSFMWISISIPSILWGIRWNGWNYPLQPWRLTVYPHESSQDPKRKVLSSSKQKTASAGSC